MKVGIIGSTKVGYELSKEEAIMLSGKSAGICYMPDTLETLFNEPKEKTEKRAKGTLVSGHHSVYGHPTYNLSFEGIPKILAMVLNNEKAYNTSEKSARYTKMEPSLREKELYEKWIDIYFNQILKIYPDMPEKDAMKLAQENARYLISVFTPATIMEHTLSFGQLNYIINWAKEYIENSDESNFAIKLKEVLNDFINQPVLKELYVPELNTKVKERGFSIFAKRKRENEFGENYCVTYLGTFAELAQAHRHRTLSYEMMLLNEPKFYVPKCIRGTKYEDEWLKDISSLADCFPQGMLVQINERGTVENFVLKCTERLCGVAQLEIADQTKQTMNMFLDNTKDSKPEIYEYLLPYSKGARCTFPSFNCARQCIHGPKFALDRLV